MTSKPPPSQAPPGPALPSGCSTCGADAVTHVRGLVGWCSAHAPPYAYRLSGAPNDPQPRAARAPEAGLLVPSIGRIVAYTLGGGPRKGQDRPAIVTRFVGDQPGAWVVLALFVFCAPGDGLEAHAIEAGYSLEPLELHWRWPPR